MVLSSIALEVDGSFEHSSHMSCTLWQIVFSHIKGSHATFAVSVSGQFCIIITLYCLHWKRNTKEQLWKKWIEQDVTYQILLKF